MTSAPKEGVHGSFYFEIYDKGLADGITSHLCKGENPQLRYGDLTYLCYGVSQPGDIWHISALPQP
jgi:hypothetical protein